MNHRIDIPISIAMLGALVVVSPAYAQRGFGAKPAPMGRVAWGSLPRMGERGGFRPRHSARPMFLGREHGRGWGPGWGYFPYSDYYEYPENESPVTEESAQEWAAPPAPARPPEKIPPAFLLERQGDRWVQVTGYPHTTSPTQSAAAEITNSTDLRAANPGANDAAKLPPAVLVFRDGHHEEIQSYTIIGNNLYTSANYWTSGSWTKRIEISSLDLSATLKLNEERGSKFSLPSGPEQISIRL